MAHRVRLDSLTRLELLELADLGCASAQIVRNRADALIAQRHPLPAWCAEILLSVDVLEKILHSLASDTVQVAAVCSAWRTAWLAQLRRRRHVRRVRVLPLPKAGEEWQNPLSIAVMPDGVVCVATGENPILPDDDALDTEVENSGKLCFISPQGEPLDDGGNWNALQNLRWERPVDVILHHDVMYVADEGRCEVWKIRLFDGQVLARAMLDETVGDMALGDNRLIVSCGVLEGTATDTTWILDAATLDLVAEIDVSATCCAVHGDKIYLGTANEDGKCALSVHSLHDGRHIKFVHVEMGMPIKMAIHNDQLFLIAEEVKNDAYESLNVLSLEGEIEQTITFRDAEGEGVRDIHVYKDHIYLLAYSGHAIHVLE